MLKIRAEINKIKEIQEKKLKNPGDSSKRLKYSQTWVELVEEKRGKIQEKEEKM